MINSNGFTPINTNLTEITKEAAEALAVEIVQIVRKHAPDGLWNATMDRLIANAIADKAGKCYDPRDECWKVRRAE